MLVGLPIKSGTHSVLCAVICIVVKGVWGGECETQFPKWVGSAGEGSQ